MAAKQSARRSLFARGARPGLALLALSLGQVLAPAGAARAQDLEREVVLRFLPPPGPVDGYRVLLTSEATSVLTRLDVGYVAPDASGVGSTAVLLDGGAYVAAVTAYNGAGESAPSNEIRIPPELCDAGSCEDGNACTVGSCDTAGCVQTPVPDGTACDDGSTATQGDRCVAGECTGEGATLAVQAVVPDAVSAGTFDIEVRGAGFSSGASLRFENGGGTAPRVRSLGLVDAQTLAARIEVRAKRPARTRYWDVVVSLPDGSTARLVRGLRVDP